MPTNSVILTRTERLRITVDAPAEWTQGEIKDAVLSIANDLDPVLPLGLGRVTIRVDRVDIGSSECDDPEWVRLDLSIGSDGEDDSDDEDEDEDEDEDDSDDDSDDDDSAGGA